MFFASHLKCDFPTTSSSVQTWSQAWGMQWELMACCVKGRQKTEKSYEVCDSRVSIWPAVTSFAWPILREWVDGKGWVTVSAAEDQAVQKEPASQGFKPYRIGTTLFLGTLCDRWLIPFTPSPFLCLIPHYSPKQRTDYQQQASMRSPKQFTSSRHFGFGMPGSLLL